MSIIPEDSAGFEGAIASLDATKHKLPSRVRAYFTRRSAIGPLRPRFPGDTSRVYREIEMGGVLYVLVALGISGTLGNRVEDAIRKARNEPSGPSLYAEGAGLVAMVGLAYALLKFGGAV